MSEPMPYEDGDKLMAEWVSPRDVFGKSGSKPYVRAVDWLQTNAKHNPRFDPNDGRRRLYHQDDIAAYQRKARPLHTEAEWLALLREQLDVPRSPQEIAHHLFVHEAKDYADITIKKWLERFVKSGNVVRTGRGVCNAPYRYQLAKDVQ